MKRRIRSSLARKGVPAASRKGRDRQSAGARGGVRDSVTGDAAVPRSAKPWKAARSIHESITKADLRAVLIICAVACLSLFLLEFVGAEETYARLYPPSPYEPDPYWVLRVKAWWVMWILISFVAVPVIAMLCMRTKGLRDCNLSFSGFAKHFWIYVGLFVAVFPVIWIVSQTRDFYTFYPMYPAAGRFWKDFLMWGVSRHMGVLSVPVSVMPYMMLHFTKPAPEAAASVVAGFVLGWLALKYRSIWGGVCVHCAVAVSMDLLALSHKNQLPWAHH